MTAATAAPGVGAIGAGEDQRTGVLIFVRSASRSVKRAAVRTGSTVWEGVKVVGRGFAACLPYVGFLTLVGVAVAAILGAAYLNLMFIQFAFTVSPLIGYLLVLITAVQLVGVLIGGVHALTKRAA